MCQAFSQSAIMNEFTRKKLTDLNPVSFFQRVVKFDRAGNSEGENVS
jgi:hypothetical protein